MIAILQDQGQFSWADQNRMHPLGIGVMVLVCAAILLLRRRHVTLPILGVVMFVPTDQQVVIAGLDFSVLRMLIITGWARVIFCGELRGFRWTRLDLAVLAWAAAFVTANLAREGAVVYSLGWLLENLGAYFLFRMLFRSWEDIYQFVLWGVVVAVPGAILFLIEKITQHNVLSIFGGILEVTSVRDGKVRCKGAFQHPILAGCYFAGFFPLLVILYTGIGAGLRHRWMSTLGMVCAVTIIICSASSTPLMGLLAGIGAAAMYRLRKELPYIRWGGVVCLIGLHLVMKQPVWHLLARVDLTGSSTGYHRFLLVDSTIRRFSEWALMGVHSTEHWGYFLFDVTGHFVLQCTSGGLLSFVCFVAVLTFAFRGVGWVARLQAMDRRRQLAIWMVGAALFAQCINFLGVSYFGKPLFLWHLNLALIGSMVAGHASFLAGSGQDLNPGRSVQRDIVPAAVGVPVHAE